jgi:diguanylate cyclase (GGDEF)-like protein
MRIFRRDLLIFAGLAAFLLIAVWSAVVVTSRAVDELLRQDAKTEGEAWARYLAANVRDLGQIVAGENPDSESLAFFEKAQKVGGVFLYKIYAPNGRLRLSSHALDEVNPAEELITVHNPEAAEAVRAGKTVVEVKSAAEAGAHEEEEDVGAALPAFYAEAYVPVIEEGAVIGIMEAYVDQSAKRAAFHSRIESVALSLAGIIAIAFGLPALGFTWRTRQKRQSDSRAEYLTDHDALTEVLNRARFIQDLDEAIRLGCPVAVHIVDINGFKEINDTYGQATGDDILRQAARRLLLIAEKQNLLARIGGDVFALAEIVRAHGQTSQTARRIVASLAETFHASSHDVELTASVGIAVAPAHGEDAAGLVKSGEIALFHAKSEGRGARSLFRPEMDAELRARRELESLIRNAVANEAFELHFQPIRNTSDIRLRGFEALLRLPKADGGSVSPALFVPVAERLGLIGEIGKWVIRNACATAATWPSKLSVAVNLSPAQFQDGRLAETLRETLNVTGLAADRLEVEITEGLLLSHTDGLLTQLAELKALGIRIAMDDFGTGYSSLSYLWKFPFDKLKIDQSFVRALGNGDQQHPASIIETVVALGRSLGMRINAEGVETKEQAVFLARVGCDELQGFYLGKPMAAESVASVILKDFRSALPKKPQRARAAAGTEETARAREA